MRTFHIFIFIVRMNETSTHSVACWVIHRTLELSKESMLSVLNCSNQCNFYTVSLWRIWFDLERICYSSLAFPPQCVNLSKSLMHFLYSPTSTFLFSCPFFLCCILYIIPYLVFPVVNYSPCLWCQRNPVINIWHMTVTIILTSSYKFRFQIMLNILVKLSNSCYGWYTTLLQWIS